jgi:hypothetical protein
LLKYYRLEAMPWNTKMVEEELDEGRKSGILGK